MISKGKNVPIKLNQCQLAGSCDEGETDVAAMGYRACNRLYVAPAPLSAGGSAKMASKVRNRVRNVSWQ